MADDIELQKQVNRGVQAKLLLENSLLTEAFASLESEYANALFMTKLEDQPAREKFYLAFNVVGKVRNHLTMMVQNGHVAATELKSLTADAERKKKFGIL